MGQIASIFQGAAKDGGHRVPFQNRQIGIATGRKRCENDRITGGSVTLRDKIPLVSVVGMDAGRYCQQLFLVLDSFSINRKIGMPEDTPNFSIVPDGGVTPSDEFTYNGHRVEIVPPDTLHLIGNYWQIKIDGILQRNFLFNSARTAADQAEKFIERQEGYSASE